MAVDTRAKRLSMLSFSSGSLLSDPSGTVDAPARATFLNLYSGISLTEAVAIVVDAMISPIFKPLTKSIIRPLVR